VGRGLDSGGADQAGERTRGIGPAGKAENVDFVAAYIVLGEVPVGGLDDFAQADADGPAKHVLEEVGVAADAFMIEGDLPGSVGGPGPDQGRAGLRIIGIELGNVGVVALALFVPGAVDQADNALHDHLYAERCTLELEVPQNLDLTSRTAISLF